MVLFCAHDNFQSFHYNDISKQKLTNHIYSIFTTSNTSYVLLEIFMQFIAAKADMMK